MTELVPRALVLLALVMAAAPAGSCAVARRHLQQGAGHTAAWLLFLLPAQSGC